MIVGLLRRREVFAWAMYDWANSSHALVITSLMFPTYYSEVTPSVVRFFSWDWQRASLYSLAITLAYSVVALVAPPLGAYADLRGRRLVLMGIFCALGAATTALLGLYQGEHVVLFLLVFALSLVGYAGSLVFYNAFLPRLVASSLIDQVSALGFSLGYIGSVLLGAGCVLLVVFADRVGLAVGEAFRVSFVLTGIWWLGFALIPLRVLHEERRRRSFPLGWLIRASYQRLVRTFHVLRTNEGLRVFWPVFFLFSMGLQTVMFLAALYASEEVSLTVYERVLTILALQLIAIPGAHMLAWLTRYVRRSVVLSGLALFWSLLMVYAWWMVGKLDFYVLAVCIGFCMGGTQSLLRATYALYIRSYPGRYAVFFGFYEAAEKLAIVLGTLLFGVFTEVFQTMRAGAVVLAGVFLVTGILAVLLPGIDTLRSRE